MVNSKVFKKLIFIRYFFESDTCEFILDVLYMCVYIYIFIGGFVFFIFKGCFGNKSFLYT